MYKKMSVHKIICGDCIEEMKKMENGSINLIFEDPPYNLIGLDVFMDIRTYIGMAKERARIYHSLLKATGSVIICGRPPVLCEIVLIMQEQGFIFSDWITWHKVDSITAVKNKYSTNYEVFSVFRRTPFSKFNHIPIQSKTNNYSSERNIGSVWEHCKISSQHKEGTKHPNQKPIKFLDRFIRTFTNKNDLVFDPFLGSGTTLIVSEKLKRNSIGIEISKEYCELAYKRLKNEVEQTKLGKEQSTIERIGF